MGEVLQITESVSRKNTSVVCRRSFFLRWYKILVLVFQLKKFKTCGYMPSCISWGFFPSYRAVTEICDAKDGTEVAQRHVLCGISFMLVSTFHFRLISFLYQCQHRGSSMQFGDTEALANIGVALHKSFEAMKSWTHTSTNYASLPLMDLHLKGLKCYVILYRSATRCFPNSFLGNSLPWSR
jgi:hypothetical protein